MAVEKVVIPDDETQEQKQERLRKELEERKAKEAKEVQEAEERRKAEEEAARKKAEEEGDKGGSTGNGEEETESEQVEIDGTLYTLDDNGNAVDDNGEIKFTKEQIDAMSDEEPNELDGDYIEAISKASGIVIKDEKGEPVKFEPTIEGFAKREAAVKALGEREGFAKGFNEFLANNPDIAALVEYKSKFGTIEGYSANVDYSKVEIKDDDNLLADLIYKAEIQKGTSPERAKRIVEFAKANNTLKDDATESLNWLRKTQESEIKAIREREAKEMQAELEKEIKYFGVSYEDDGTVKVHNAPGSLYDLIVVKGQIGEYALPKEGLRIKTTDGEKLVSRQELFDYFSRPVQEINGMVYSQAQIDEINRLSNPAELAMRFIMNLDGGVDQLIKAELAKKEVKRLRSLASKTGKNNGNPRVQKTAKDDKIVLPIK
jgi:hypothetical protein